MLRSTGPRSTRPRFLLFSLFSLGSALLLISSAPGPATARTNCDGPALLFSKLSSPDANCPALRVSGVASAPALPANFQDTTVFSTGLYRPTAVRFANDGRVFVANKSGLIKVFASLTATTPSTFADLRTEVDDFWDRGLLGLALDPDFPANPYVYVLYTFDAPIGRSAPAWNDACPTPPGPTTDGCVVSGRLSRLTTDPTGTTVLTETVLLNAWCQQFPSHSVGTLFFGPDG